MPDYSKYDLTGEDQEKEKYNRYDQPQQRGWFQRHLFPTEEEIKGKVQEYTKPHPLRALGAGAVKATTAGYLPEIEAAKVSKEAFPTQATIGEFVGYAAPIGVAGKVSAATKLGAKAPWLAKAAIRGATTGGIYGAARKPEEGEDRLTNALWDAVLFAGFDGALSVVGRYAPPAVAKLKSWWNKIGGKGKVKPEQIVEKAKEVMGAEKPKEVFPKAKPTEALGERSMREAREVKELIEKGKAEEPITNWKIEHGLKSREIYDATYKEFLDVFGERLDKYWNPYTRFDVVKFDEVLIKPKVGESTLQATKRRFGQKGIDIIDVLLERKPSQPTVPKPAVKPSAAKEPWEMTVYRGGEIGKPNVMRTDAGYYGEGIYFSESPHTAAVYAKKANGILTSANIKLNKPFILDWTNLETASYTKTLAKDLNIELSGSGMFVQSGKATTILKNNGYDGVIVKRPNEPIEVVAFNKSSIINKPVPPEVLAEQMLESGEAGGLAPESIPPLKGMIEGAEGRVFPKYAGSINLERMEADEAVKSIIEHASKYTEKTKIPWAKETAEKLGLEKSTEQMAGELGITPKQAQKYAKQLGEGQFTAIIDGLRQLHRNTVGNLEGIMRQVPDRAMRTDAFRAKVLEEWTKYVDLVKSTQSLSAEAGRALSVHRRMMKYPEKYVEKLDEIFSEISGGKVDAKKLDDFIDKLVHLDWSNLNETRAFADKFTQPKFFDYLMSYWYNSILSGPPTHIINTQSNAMWQTFHNVVIRPARAIVDIPIAKLQGRQREYYLREVLPSWRGMIQGSKKGFAKALEMIKRGYVEDDATKWAMEMGKAADPWSQSPHKILRKAAPAVTASSRALRAMDLFFKGMAYESEMNAKAVRLAIKGGKRGSKQIGEEVAKLLQNPTQDMLKTSTDFASYATFMDEPGRISGAILGLRNKIPATRLVIPFVTTIGNLLKRGLEFTPGVGAFVRGGIPKGSYVSEVITKQIIGAGVGMYIWAKYMDGEITGAAPKSKAERDAWYRQGRQPWSVKIGNNWLSFRRIEPFNTPISTVVSALDAWRDRGKLPPDALATKFAQSMGRNLMDASYLSGLSDFITAIESGAETEEALMKFPARQMGGFMPYSSLLRSGVRATESFGEGEATVKRPIGIIETLKSQIPFVASDVRERLDVWGEPAKYQTPTGGEAPGAFRQFYPVRWSEETKDPLELELWRLKDKLEGFSYPGMPTKKKDWTDEDYDKFVKLSGRRAKERLDRLVRAPMYRFWSDERKAKEIKKIISEERRKARG